MTTTPPDRPASDDRLSALGGRRRVLGLVVALIVIVGVLVALTVPGGSDKPVKAPSFSLPRLGGGPPVSLPVVGEDAHDPVVLTFFASWCPPCRAELPTVARIARQERARGTRVVFLGIDGNDSSSAGKAFARQAGVEFPVGSDGLSAVGPRFGLSGYPGTVFVAADGDVVGTVHGPVTAVSLRSWLARLTSSA